MATMSASLRMARQVPATASPFYMLTPMPYTVLQQFTFAPGISREQVHNTLPPRRTLQSKHSEVVLPPVLNTATV